MSSKPDHLPDSDLNLNPPAPQNPRPAFHAVSPLKLDRLHTGDCLNLFPNLEAGTIDLVFADPPL